MTTKISTNNLDTSVTTLIAQGGGPKIASIAYLGDDTAADTAGGQTITLTGSGFAAGAAVIINGQAVGVVSVVSSTTITFTSPALSAGSYPVYVVNTDGGTAILVPGIQYSGTPTWSTAAGSLGSYTETVAINNTVTATGDAPVTYSLFSGSLPTGANLNANTGVISGTSPISASPTTYTFTIRATDAQNQDTNRQFSLTINPDVVTWSSPADGTNYTSAVNSAIANVSLSASAASGQTVSYAANALPTGLSLSANVISGTPTVTGNVTTLLTATANVTNRTATRTISWTISVASDTYFPYVATLLSADTPTSTFVTDASTNAFAVTVNGDTRPSNFGPYTPGYYSGSFSSGGISWPGSAALALGTGDFTIECWVNYTSEASRFLTNRVSFSAGSGTWSWSFNSTSIAFVTVIPGEPGVSNSSVSIPTNRWNHLAVVRSSGVITFYVNGTSFAGGSFGYDLGNTDQSYLLGSTSEKNGFNFTGFISNLRILKGTALYTSSFTPSTTPLTAVANTQLLICQSNRFRDESNNNVALTPSSATISGFDPFVPSSSYSSYGSTYFDGTGDYLDVINSSTCSNFGTSDFTVEGWFYLQSSASQILYDFRTGQSDAAGALYYSGTNINWYVSGADRITGSALALNQWYHIAVARSGTSTKLFVNGTQVGSTYTDTTNYIGNTNRPRMGFLGDGTGTLPYTGYMSNLRVVKGTAVYTTTFTPPTTPLTAVANTSLLTCQSNQPNNNSMFLDGSTNNFNITRNGNTTQGSFSPYGGGWSTNFPNSAYMNVSSSSGAYLRVTNTSAFDMGTGDFTMEGWICPLTFPSSDAWPTNWWQHSLLFGRGSPSVADGYNLILGATRLIFQNSDTNVANGLHGMSVGNWYHVAACRSSGTLRLFVNGVQVASASFSGTVGGGSNFYIGCETGEGAYFNGYMSNIRVLKGTALYTTTFTPSTTPLTPITNTQLLTCSDNRFLDDSFNNYTVVPVNSPTIQRFNPWNPVVTTPTSYSGYFDGTGDYLSLTGSGLGSGNFTIEMWVYMTSYPNAANAIYSNGNSDNVNASTAVVYINSSGTLAIYNYPTSITTSTTVPLNQWNHIAVVRNSGTITLYINGTSGGSGANSNNISNTTMQIMQGYGGISASPIGYVSNVRVVVGTAVYTSNFTPSTSPLTAVANTSLLTLQNATFIDNSTNNFTITANGDSVPRQFNPFGVNTTTGSSAAYAVTTYGGSGYFDGTGDNLTLASNDAFSFGTGSLTVEAWIYTGVNGTQGIVSFGNATTAQPYFYLNGLTPTFFYNNTSVVTGPNIVLNAWNHIAWVRSASFVRVFTNGVSGTSISAFIDTFSTSGLWIGSNNSGAQAFNGYITDVRITKGLARYTSNFQPPVAPLTALQNTVLLNNMTGAGIYDSSMITTYETAGNASISTSLKKYGNTSLYFDGTGDYLFTPTSPNLTFGTGDFTVEMWLRTGTTADQLIFDMRLGSGNGAYPTLYYSGGSLVWYVSSAARITSSAIAQNTWYHVAVSRSGTSTKMFLNGVQTGSTYTDSTNYLCDRLFIGASASGGGTVGFLGYLDDVRITKGVARYTSNFTPTNTPFLKN